MASASETVIRSLGNGGYGLVDEVIVDGKHLARKKYKRAFCPSAIRETAFLSSVEHPNIIRLERDDFTPSRTAIYLE